MLRTFSAAVAAATLAVAPFAFSPAAQAATPAASAEFRFGVSWYPEQWPRERWETDLQLMQKAGFNTVRLAEFSWSTLEPEEGKYDFAWLDDAIALATKHGMKVVLGTPTAAPPAWLTQKYPEMLRVDEAGVAAGHGGRRHFSFASAKYRTFARDIATRMAERYGRNPAVIGWQIDNEVGPPSFDPESVAAWHAFLKKKYGTIDTLNDRWTTEYWSQHYNSFDQVPLHATGQQNPGLLLDFKHFCTDTWKSYIDSQADAIRAAVDKRQFITTNTMFWNAGFDHFEIHRNLDIAAWDNYITDGKPDWVANGANHDLVRGYKQKNFWLMETQPDRVDWVPVNVTLAPGQIREMAWQAVGHGADAVLYWQWRPARTGQEQYHGTLLGQDGTPVPAFAEVAATGTELAKAAAALDGTTPVAKVAFLWSYDSRWSIDLQPHNKDFNPVKAFTAIYRPFRVQSQSVDVISADADLTKYPIVVAPNLNVLTQSQADRLSTYVKGGGHLIIGPRTGMKTEDNALWTQRQPGPLAATLGGRVEQYFALDKPVGVTGSFGTGTSNLWAEWLSPQAKDVKVLETYTDPGGWLDGKAAIIRRPVGKGDITYVGGWFDDATLSRIATEALQGAGVKPVLNGVDGDIEVCERDGPNGRVLILINHGAAAHPVSLPAGAKPLLGQWQDGQIAAHGIAVFMLAN